MSEVSITGLNIYPIKSAGGIPLESSEVVATGLQYDRQFMLVDEQDVAVTQRNMPNGPRLALVELGIQTYPEAPKDWPSQHRILSRKPNGRLDIKVPGFGETDISTFLPSTKHGAGYDYVEALIHGNPVTGVAVGGEVDTFFSEYLDQPVRLIRTISSHVRALKERRQRPGATNITGFADGYSILLTSQKSLDALNAHMAGINGSEGPIPMDRFRPNIVVDGENLQAYDEDYWRKLTIGCKLGAYVVKPCDRCVIPDIDQQTANVGKAVRQTLAATRRGTDESGDAKGVFFGQNLNHALIKNIHLRVGDTVAIEQASDTSNVLLAKK